MERMLSQQSLTAPLATAYLANYTGTINYITSNGAYAIIDPHNYGRFYSSIITDTAGFQTFWQNLAGHFKSNSLVVFDTNNELVPAPVLATPFSAFGMRSHTRVGSTDS